MTKPGTASNRLPLSGPGTFALCAASIPPNLPIKQIIKLMRHQYIRPSHELPCLKSSYRAENLSHRHFNTWG
jgi:hypothetical protein